jgi:hypothetical protein
MEVLPILMKIHKVARMAGDYNNSKSLLVTDKLAGTQAAVMGFVEEKGYYIPNTILKEDLRNLVVKPGHRILAIFIKCQKDKRYTELSHIAKGITIEDDLFKIVGDKVEFEKLTATFQIPRMT